MSTKDIASDLTTQIAQSSVIAANGVSTGVAIDNADFDLGLMFVAVASAWTDGAYVLGAVESDDDITYTAVPAEKIIGSASVVAAAAAGVDLPKIGVFSNKRYVKSTLTATGVTLGATIGVFAVQKTEYAPA